MGFGSYDESEQDKPDYSREDEGEDSGEDEGEDYGKNVNTRRDDGEVEFEFWEDGETSNKEKIAQMLENADTGS